MLTRTQVTAHYSYLLEKQNLPALQWHLDRLWVARTPPQHRFGDDNSEYQFWWSCLHSQQEFPQYHDNWNENRNEHNYYCITEDSNYYTLCRVNEAILL